MNIHMQDSDLRPGRAEAEAALATLRLWAARASEAEIVALDPQAGALVGQGYPVLSRDYPQDFRADSAYKDSLPDLQNGPSSLIVGEKAVIYLPAAPQGRALVSLPEEAYSFLQVVLDIEEL